MLRKAVYPQIESYLNQAAEKLNQHGFTPNQLTLAGLALTFLAGCIYASGHFFFAGVFLILASLGDMLDGPLARLTKKSSPFGAFLDSTVDRYSDFFIFGGLACYFARQNQGGWFLIMMGIILGAYITSYSKARAESLMKDCSVGMFERAERIILLVLGSLLWPLLGLVLWVLLIGTHVTALQRIFHIKNALEAKPEHANEEHEVEKNF